MKKCTVKNQNVHACFNSKISGIHILKQLTYFIYGINFNGKFTGIKDYSKIICGKNVK